MNYTDHSSNNPFPLPSPSLLPPSSSLPLFSRPRHQNNVYIVNCARHEDGLPIQLQSVENVSTAIGLKGEKMDGGGGEREEETI